ncbi:VWA domain-containing protein [Desulfobacterales bacterium HSG16]|nr:VWA domain-containing protein [Desulfobacterales bacterium HSG16]
MADKLAPEFLWELFSQLRRRGFPLCPADYEDLKRALQAAFGWSSHNALRDLCVALWSKSRHEKKILESLFDQREEPLKSEWILEENEPGDLYEPNIARQSEESETIDMSESIETAISPGALPPIRADGLKLPEYPFVLQPLFPLSDREVAQAWRRLRQPVRYGPPVELDIDATVAHRCKSGIVSDIVMVPRRRNTASLLLLVDRQGSMAPFHGFVDHVCSAIQRAGKLENVALFYFHDSPSEGSDEAVLDILSDKDDSLFPVLDTILHDIQPLSRGFLYNDPDLLSTCQVGKALEENAEGAAVVIISDAGAARGKYDVLRLLDTIAFLKALRKLTTRYVWINPLPRDSWEKTNNTATQISRHTPMLSLDRSGMHLAVNILRGQPHTVDKPI